MLTPQVIAPRLESEAAPVVIRPRLRVDPETANVGTSFFGESLLNNALITEAAGMLIGSVMSGDLDLTSLLGGG